MTQMHEESRADRLNNRVPIACAVLGVVALGAAGAFAATDEARTAQFFRSYFVAFCFCLSLSLGALFFVILHHLVHAAWSVVVRRIAELLAAAIVILALLFLPILAFGLKHVFLWAGAHSADLAPTKAEYLQPFWFGVRCLVYFSVWIALALVFWRRSVEQDKTGDVRLSARNQWLSAPAMLVFGFSISFAAMDLLMDVNPHWHSTIFGVYFFSGSAVAIFAALPLLAMILQRAGVLAKEITVEHYHDLGKLLFAFVFFWTYIAFSQYMLIWYADLPDETNWFYNRASPDAGPWNYVALALLFGHWLIPFVALLSRDTKRIKPLLALWCVWLLTMHYVDLYWVVMPDWSPGALTFSLMDLACLVGVTGIYLAAAAFLAGRGALIPVKDPRLAESLAFENY
jgi:hypothetical protein